MNKDSLGDRMKRYENVSRNYLTPRSNVIIRIDGKTFHTFTKTCAKPFDFELISVLVDTTKEISKHIQGFKMAYCQSDEISILINDTDTIQTQGRFDYNISKICSVVASLFTGYFNQTWQPAHCEKKLAFFDARCFNIPEDDIANYFLWRQQDRYRNSVQMFARSHFTQKELQGKTLVNIFDMLHEKGESWEENISYIKNGTFIDKDGNVFGRIRPHFLETNEFVQKNLSVTKEEGASKQQ